MIDPNTQGYSPQNQEHAPSAADHVLEGFLAFMANLFGAFTTVDPRVITREGAPQGSNGPRFLGAIAARY